MELLKIKDLHAKAGEKDILKGLDLTINKGEVHVIMGPNGAGKSTLANVIMHNPEYNIESGEIHFDGENVTDMKADEIARRGVFMSFQNPEEVPGINLTNFLKTAKNSITGEPVRLFEFKKEI
jgi:Fe-S cluster assembly ATP-binding protein